MFAHLDVQVFLAEESFADHLKLLLTSFPRRRESKAER